MISIFILLSFVFVVSSYEYSDYYNSKTSDENYPSIYYPSQYNKIESSVIDSINYGFVDVIVILDNSELEGKSIQETKKIVKEKQDDVLKDVSSYDFILENKYQVIPGFSGKINKAALDKFNSNNKIKFIYSDKILHTTLAESISLINANTVHEIELGDEFLQGKGQTICIIDSGIDYTHPDLGGCLGEDCKIISGVDFVNDDNDPMDDNGHGTLMAGIISANGTATGVAPESKILAAKSCNENSRCIGSNIIAGVDWCVTNLIDLGGGTISVSLGDDGSYTDQTCPTWMNSAITAASEANLPLVVSSGNNGHNNGISYPACSSEVISVGSSYDTNFGRRDQCTSIDCSQHCTDENIEPDTAVCSSNSHEILDLIAPGSVIRSTRLGGGHSSRSGTSQAAAHVAGVITLMKQANSDLTVEQIETILKSSEIQVTDPDNNLTFPRVDAENAIRRIIGFEFIRGDANRDGIVDVSDGVKILLSLYRGETLGCLDAADVNDDGTVDISDPPYLFNYLYQGGDKIPEPFANPGSDPTEDEINCEN